MNEIFDDLFYHGRDIKLSSFLVLYFDARMSVIENLRNSSTLKYFPFNNLDEVHFNFERKLFERIIKLHQT